MNRTDNTKRITYVLFIVLMALSVLTLLEPGTAEANWTKNATCIGCHSNLHATSTINVAVDGTETTSAALDNDGVDSIEIDWKFEGSEWTSSKESNGVLIAVPDGWSVSAGTTNSPGITNWSSAWDSADGLSWTFLADQGDCPANYDCYAVQFLCPWDHDSGGENMACNVASCETGTDQDGVASRMGTDAVVKTSVSETAGAYSIMVYGIGYDGNQKAYKSQTINVTVSAPAANNAPNAPADHAQYRNDGSTALSNGQTTNETTVKFKATVSDSDSDDTKLEVEIISNASSYAGTVTCSSGFVTSGTVATVTCSSLSDGVSYKWRARTNDGTDTSAWQTWGGADPDVTVKTAMDVGIDTSANSAPTL